VPLSHANLADPLASYRDDHQAALHRAEALSRQLAEKERELAESERALAARDDALAKARRGALSAAAPEIVRQVRRDKAMRNVIAGGSAFGLLLSAIVGAFLDLEMFALCAAGVVTLLSLTLHARYNRCPRCRKQLAGNLLSATAACFRCGEPLTEAPEQRGASGSAPSSARFRA
jgi:Flp pilus assembly protein TadB